MLYTLRRKSIDVEERVNLLLHSLGAFSIPRETLREYYESQRKELDKIYGKV